MTTPSGPAIARARGLAVLALTVLGLTALLGACGSRAAASPAVSAATVRATCDRVSAVLSDGPDPTADPVGYAEAQVIPLGQIRAADAQLRAAISSLARAYRAFFASDGTSGAAKAAVAAASKRIDSFCPGAAS
jgi:hypothetical protein